MSQTENRQIASSVRKTLNNLESEVRSAFSQKQAAREAALPLSRKIIQHSANSIRATHRSEFDVARKLLNGARNLLKEAEETLQGHPNIYFAGFLEDAQKEYAEASATLAFAEGSPLPGPQELNVGYAPYLNGLGEAVGELRRYILDSLRHDDTSRCEDLLTVMDDVYSLLVTIDFPDAITRGLRRTTDMVRGVLERTRGDLTLALRQRSLEQKLTAFEKNQEE